MEIIDFEKKKRISRYAITLGHFCTDINSGSLTALLPFLIAAHNYNYSTAAALVFFMNIIASVVQPLFGIIADKKDMPWMMTAAMLLCSCSMALTGYVESYAGIVICVLIAGCASAMFHPQATRYVNKLSQKSHAGGAISIFSFGGSMGFTLGPIIITLAITTFGLKGTGAFAIPALLASGFLISRSKDYSKKTLDEYEKIEDNTMNGKRAVDVPDQWGPFVKLSFFVFSRSVVLMALNTFLSLFYINVLGTSETFGNSMIAFYNAVSTITTLFGGMVADKYGYRKTIKLSMIVLGVSLVVFSITRSIPLSILCLIPIGCSINLSYSPLVVLGQRYLPNRVGLASGLTLGLSMSFGGMFSPLYGMIGDKYGLEVVMYLIAAFTIVPIITSFFLKEPIQDRK